MRHLLKRFNDLIRNPIGLVVLVFTFFMILSSITLFENIKNAGLLADSVEVILSTKDRSPRVVGITRNDVVYDFESTNPRIFKMSDRYLKSIRISHPEQLDSVWIKTGEENLVYNREDIAKKITPEGFLEISLERKTLVPIFRNIINYKGDRSLLIEIVTLIVLGFFSSVITAFGFIVLFTFVRVPDKDLAPDKTEEQIPL